MTPEPMDDTTSGSIQEFLDDLVETLPRTVQYPEIAAARIRCGSHTATTGGFEPRDRNLSVGTETPDGTSLELELVYLEERPPADVGPFRAEERASLETFAELLGGYVQGRVDDATPPAGEARDEQDSQRQDERDSQRQDERLDEFASIVSHELRNPLNAAQGHLELAKEQYEDDFETVFRSLDRMERLITDAVTLARGGGGIESSDRIDLRRLAEDRWASVDPEDATLEVELRGWIVGGQDRLTHLFEHLFDNAVAHGGPEVTVRVEPIDEGFAVTDDGSGIPVEEHERVFEAGYSTATDGTGFGLPIIEEIAGAHGWDVCLTESSDGGARFEFHGVEFD